MSEGACVRACAHVCVWMCVCAPLFVTVTVHSVT